MPDMNAIRAENVGQRGTMSRTADESSNLLPTAKQVMEKVALREAENASEAMHQKAKADAEKKALIDRLTKSSGVSEAESLSGRPRSSSVP
jgi:hypothetical protein